MRRTLTARGHYYFAGLLFIATGLGAYGCVDTASISEGPQVKLSSLTVSPAGLQPAFSSATTNYTLNVPSTVTSVTVMATPEDNATSITIAGTATRSLTVDLNPPGSSKDITIALTSQSGSQSTYTIGVNRALPLSGNNDLTSLTVSSGSLTPTFSPGTLAYTLDVATAITDVTVTATKSDPNAVISGDVPNGGQATIQLDGPGTSKTVSITVTAPSGTSKTYTIVVTRLLPSSDNNLSSLTVTPGSLSPGFSPNILNYDVSSSAGSLTVSATKADPDAVMSGAVSAGTGVPTGTATIPLGGPVATTRISITVTAPNGDSKTYRITVSRPFR
jgi:hypothetical protein